MIYIYNLGRCCYSEKFNDFDCLERKYDQERRDLFVLCSEERTDMTCMILIFLLIGGDTVKTS